MSTLDGKGAVHTIFFPAKEKMWKKAILVSVPLKALKFYSFANVMIY